ncbi:hypothetical protein D3C81_239490 [compost metagenome]
MFHVAAAGFHGAAEEQEEAGKGQDGDEGKAPVHGEQIENRNGDGADGARRCRVKVGGEAVQGIDVVLHRLLDLARGAAGKPAQRYLPQALHGLQAQLMGDAVVGQMRGQLAQRNQRHAGKQAGHAGEDGGPDARLRLRDRRVQRDAGDMRDASQRHQGQHGTRACQHGGKDQTRADGLQNPADRASLSAWATHGKNGKKRAWCRWIRVALTLYPERKCKSLNPACEKFPDAP